MGWFGTGKGFGEGRKNANELFQDALAHVEKANKAYEEGEETEKDRLARKWLEESELAVSAAASIKDSTVKQEALDNALKQQRLAKKALEELRKPTDSVPSSSGGTGQGASSHENEDNKRFYARIKEIRGRTDISDAKKEELIANLWEEKNTTDAESDSTPKAGGGNALVVRKADTGHSPPGSPGGSPRAHFEGAGGAGETGGTFNAEQWVKSFFERNRDSENIRRLFDNCILALIKKKYVAPKSGSGPLTVENASKKEQRTSIEAFITALREDPEYEKLDSSEKVHVEFSALQKALFIAGERKEALDDSEKAARTGLRKRVDQFAEKAGSAFSTLRDGIATITGIKNFSEWAKKNPIKAQILIRTLITAGVITAAFFTGGLAAVIPAAGAVIGGQLGAFGLDKAGALLDGSAESWKKDYEKSAAKALGRGDWLRAIRSIQSSDINEIQKIMNQRSLVRKIFGGILGGGAGFAAGTWIQSNVEVIATAVKAGAIPTTTGETVPDATSSARSTSGNLEPGSTGGGGGGAEHADALNASPGDAAGTPTQTEGVSAGGGGAEGTGDVSGAESSEGGGTEVTGGGSGAEGGGNGGTGAAEQVSPGPDAGAAETSSGGEASGAGTTAEAAAAPLSQGDLNRAFSGFEGTQTPGSLKVEIVDWNAEQAGLHQANSFDQAIGHIQSQMTENLRGMTDVQGLDAIKNFLENFTRDDVGRAVGALLENHSLVVHPGDQLSMSFDPATQTFKLDFVPGAAHPAGTESMHFDLMLVPKEGGGFELVSGQRIIPNPDAFMTHPNFDAAGNVMPAPEGPVPTLSELPPALQDVPPGATLPSELYQPLMDALRESGATAMSINGASFGAGGGEWNVFSDALAAAVSRGGGDNMAITLSGGGGGETTFTFQSVGEAGEGHAVVSGGGTVESPVATSGGNVEVDTPVEAAPSASPLRETPAAEVMQPRELISSQAFENAVAFREPSFASITLGNDVRVLFVGGQGLSSDQSIQLVGELARANPDITFAARAADGLVHIYQWPSGTEALQDLQALDTRFVQAVGTPSGIPVRSEGIQSLVNAFRTAR
jgi:hypothetical protein